MSNEDRLKQLESQRNNSSNTPDMIAEIDAEILKLKALIAAAESR